MINLIEDYDNGFHKRQQQQQQKTKSFFECRFIVAGYTKSGFRFFFILSNYSKAHFFTLKCIMHKCFTVTDR